MALAKWVLPVGTCFTLQKDRVSVFSRTAIHAPGGWALIENLPHVLTGDRVTVGLTSTYLLPRKQKDCFLLHGSISSAWGRSNAAFLQGTREVVARVGTACQAEISCAMRDKRGDLA